MLQLTKYVRAVLLTKLGRVVLLTKRVIVLQLTKHGRVLLLKNSAVCMILLIYCYYLIIVIICIVCENIKLADYIVCMFSYVRSSSIMLDWVYNQRCRTCYIKLFLERLIIFFNSSLKLGFLTILMNL